MDQHYLKFLQLNCNKRKVASIEVYQHISTGFADIALLQEPNFNRKSFRLYHLPQRNVIADNNPDHIREYGNPRAAIYHSRCLSNNIIPIHHFCSRDAAVALLTFTDEGGNIVNVLIASLYFDIKRNIQSDLDLVEKLQNYANSKNYLLQMSVDSNAHNLMWGYDGNDSRGNELLRITTNLNLHIHNSRTITFMSGSKNSSIDLTITDMRLREKIFDWDTHEHLFSSDHLAITFKYKKFERTILEFRSVKNIDWDIFETVLRDNLLPAQAVCDSNYAEICADNIRDSFKIAFERSCRVTYIRTKNNKDWYNAELAAMRKEARKLFRLRYRNRIDLELYWHYDVLYKRSINSYNKSVLIYKNSSFQEFAKNIESIEEVARLTGLKRELSNHKLGSLERPDSSFATSAEEIVDELSRIHFPHHSTHIPIQPLKVLPDNYPDWILDLVEEKNLREFIFEFGPYKAPGPDKISPCMLQKSFKTIYPTIRELFIFSLASSYIPKSWLETEVIYLPKPGKKNYRDGKSFRPISLMSFLLKSLEKLINQHLEMNFNSIHKCQYAYRKNRSTVQALNDVVTTIENCFERKEYAWAGFFDISGAFDALNYFTIENTLRKIGIPDIIINWFMTMLRHRIIQSNCYGVNKLFSPKMGIPQGDVLSCKIWNYCVNELIKIMASLPGVRIFVYADDVLIMVTGRSEILIQDFFGTAINKMLNWCIENRLSINRDKSEFIRFTRNHKTIDPTLIFQNVRVTFNQKVKYLGLIFDKTLSWYPHLDYVKDKVFKYLHSIRQFFGRHWGINMKLMKWAYEAIILPKVFYASVVWFHRTLRRDMNECKKSSFLKKLEGIHSSAIRSFSYAFNSTPTLAIEASMGLLPIYESLKIRTTLDILRLHKLGQWRVDLTSNHYVANNILNIFELSKNYDVIPSTQNNTKVEIITPTLQEWLNDEVAMVYDVESYSDASVTDGRTGIGIFSADCQISYAGQADIETSSYKAELTALNHNLSMIINKNITNMKLGFFIDNKGVVTSLGHSSTKSSMIAKTLHKCEILESRNNTISLIWIPSHRAEEIRQFKLNDEADRLTRDQNALPCLTLCNLPQTKIELKRHLEGIALKRVLNEWSQCSLKTSKSFKLHELIKHRQCGNVCQCKNNSRQCNKICTSSLIGFSRSDFFVLLSFFTGHCFLRKFISKMDDTTTDLCRACRKDQETPEHLVEACENYTAERREIFGRDTLSLTSTEFNPHMILRFLEITKIKDILKSWQP